MLRPSLDLFVIDEVLGVVTSGPQQHTYEFHFEDFFPIRRVRGVPTKLTAVARIGAILEYEQLHTELLSENVLLINTPHEHLLCSELGYWYPSLEGLTPRSVVFQTAPSADVIEAEFGWPIFMKGARQTSKHQRHLSIIKGREQYANAIHSYQRDPILSWQQIAIRELLQLRLIEDSDPTSIPISFEFRCFFWKGELAGFGGYTAGVKVNISAGERAAALSLASQAAKKVRVPFMVVDVAQCANGQWTVIELNDAQESGYGCVTPIGLWQSILDLERKTESTCENHQ